MNSKFHSPGFTLVELMAAMAVLSLLMVAMVGMFDQAMRGWQSAQRGIDARREVRTALQVMDSDLRGMVVTNVILGNSTNGRPAFISLDENFSSRLTFFTKLNSQEQDTAPDNLGDLCVVQYYQTNLVRRGGAGVTTNLVLMRRMLSSAATHEMLKSNATVPTESVMIADAPSEELAINVVYFRAELKSWNRQLANYVNITNFTTTKPDLVQLELTAYSSQTAQKFRSLAEWTATSNIQKFGKTYLWRVAP